MDSTKTPLGFEPEPDLQHLRPFFLTRPPPTRPAWGRAAHSEPIIARLPLEQVQTASTEKAFPPLQETASKLSGSAAEYFPPLVQTKPLQPASLGQANGLPTDSSVANKSEDAEPEQEPQEVHGRGSGDEALAQVEEESGRRLSEEDRNVNHTSPDEHPAKRTARARAGGKHSDHEERATRAENSPPSDSRRRRMDEGKSIWDRLQMNPGPDERRPSRRPSRDDDSRPTPTASADPEVARTASKTTGKVCNNCKGKGHIRAQCPDLLLASEEESEGSAGAATGNNRNKSGMVSGREAEKRPRRTDAPTEFLREDSWEGLPREDRAWKGMGRFLYEDRERDPGGGRGGGKGDYGHRTADEDGGRAEGGNGSRRSSGGERRERPQLGGATLARMLNGTGLVGGSRRNPRS